MEKTEWYPENSRPFRTGVYEVKSPYNDGMSGWYRYWNGGHWKIGFCSPNKAALSCKEANMQDCQWRGLTENSNADD